MIEGVDYINCVRNSKNDIGKQLSYGAPIKLKVSTPLGDIGSIRNAVTFWSRDEVEISFLQKRNLSSRDIKLIERLKFSRKINYWAFIAVVVLDRIISDKDLLDNILKLPRDLFFTAFSSTTLPSGIVHTARLNKMVVYIEILNKIKIGLQAELSRDKIKEILLDEFRVDPKKDYTK